MILLDQVVMAAKRRIRAGEEVTDNYGIHHLRYIVQGGEDNYGIHHLRYIVGSTSSTRILILIKSQSIVYIKYCIVEYMA